MSKPRASMQKIEIQNQIIRKCETNAKKFPKCSEKPEFKITKK